MTHPPDKLPSFADLPVKPDAPPNSAWGLFGDHDQLGTLNLLTPERIAAAATLVRKGAVFPLNLRIDCPEPPLYGRGAPRHTIIGEGGNSRDDYIDSFWPQASSQWDGLRHIRHHVHGFYNGVADDEIIPGDTGKLGMEHFARKGIVGRGVLIDVAARMEATRKSLDFMRSDRISVDLLKDCLREQNTEVETGDILLIRTGWLNWYLESATPVQKQQLADTSARREMEAPGIAPTTEMAAFLWDLHVSAVAADNPALEAYPPATDDDFLHRTLIPLLGIPIGELWYLEDLSNDCAEDGVYEFMLTSAPLHMPGGVGSPPNALAIK
ncbi:MAG: cyclase family protein [Chloroflexi bacterium]|nr:cyclase family protein [Chloroflexota bacterium]